MKQTALLHNERKKQLKTILSVASTLIVEKEINRS